MVLDMADRLHFRIAAAVLFWLIPAWALAQDVEPQKPPPTDTSAADGAFLPLTMHARVGDQGAYLTSTAGYDGGRSSGLVQGTAEVTVWGPIAIRAGAVYAESVNTLRPTFGAHVQALRQERHGIDASVAVVYKPEGLTEGEGEIETILAFGRRQGRWNLLGNLVYGQDPDLQEADTEMRLAALCGFGRVQVGIDTRLRLGLKSKPTQDPRQRLFEADADVVAGPTGMLVLGPVALIGQVGVSAIKVGGWQTGAIGLAGFGASF
jgi:hypothetical protein